MIEFTCMYCQAKLSEPDDHAGNPSKCPKCGRTMRVPAGAQVRLPPLRSPIQMRERVEDGGEIPLADEQSSTRPAEAARQPPSSQAFRARVMSPDAGEEIGEIPFAEEPSEKKAPTPPQEPSTVTAGGLVITTSGDITGISFQHTKILDAIEIEKIDKELCALVDEQAGRRFFLDFGNVQFLSSQMLGVLMKLQKKVAAKKGRLLLCAVRPELQKVFQIVKMDRILQIVPDRNAAQGALRLP